MTDAIDRFEPTHMRGPVMAKKSDGTYVRWHDHAAEVARLTAERDEAKMQSLTHLGQAADAQDALAASEAARIRAEAERDAWQGDDPQESRAWCEGTSYVLDQICKVLKVDPKEVNWDGSDGGLEEETQSLLLRIIHHHDDEDGRNPDHAAEVARLTAARDHAWNMVAEADADAARLAAESVEDNIRATRAETALAAMTKERDELRGGVTEPHDPGDFVGDIYYGHPEYTTLGTHRWTGSEWVKLPTETEALMELLASARTALAASEERVKVLTEALRRIADYLPLFDYVGSDDFGSRHDLPGSPYDRGRADEASLLSGIARAALQGETQEGTR